MMKSILLILCVVLITGCNTIRTKGITPIDVDRNQNYADWAQSCYNEQDWDRAIAYYAKAIKDDGPKYIYYLNSGKCLEHIGRKSAAIAYFTKANSIYPETEEELLEAAYDCLATHNSKEVIELTTKIMAINPNNVPAKEMLEAGLYDKLVQEGTVGNYKEGLKTATALIKMSPYKMVYQLDKARCLYHLAVDKESSTRALLYFEDLMPKLTAGQRDWKEIGKMYAIITFKMGGIDNIMSSKVMLKKYLNGYKHQYTKDDLFWLGLMSKVTLDNTACDKYWSKLSKEYINERRNELRKY